MTTTFGSYDNRPIPDHETARDNATARAERLGALADSKETASSYRAAAAAHRDASTHYAASSTRFDYHTDMASDYETLRKLATK